MKKITVIGTVVLLSMSSALVAHDDATGVVKERMELMETLGGAMKKLVPVFRNKVPYDADLVKEQAAIIEANAGKHMAMLFPEGSVGEPSEALPEIWKDWSDFETQAMWLERYAQGLQGAATNFGDGWQTGPGVGAGMMMGRGQTGFGPGMMNRGGFALADDMMSVEHLSEMPSAGVFQMLAQTCSGCHKSYRQDDDN